MQSQLSDFELNVVKQTTGFVKEKLKGAESGHDWTHIERVWKNAKNISKTEECNLFVVELGALLHDIADWKFSGSDTEGSRITREWLGGLKVENEKIEDVCHIIDNISYKGAKVENKIKTIEGMIVQDADRLDALGAIGIARCFSYGGYRQRTMYDPEIKPTMHESYEQYKKSEGTTVNHFYEKLLLLKDKMNTKSGKVIAEERHKYMEGFLSQFFDEWEGKK